MENKKHVASETSNDDSSLKKLHESIHEEIAHHSRILIDDAEISSIEHYLRSASAEAENLVDNSMSAGDRMRMLGSGVRRFGFIEKTSDVAAEFMQFAPRAFDLDNLNALIRQIETLRNLVALADMISRLLNDLLLETGDAAFQMSLMYYNSVHELARRRVPGAETVFRLLELFFRRGRQNDDQPTIEQAERDVKALLSGRKDGEIVITGHAKHETAAEHTVIDDTHKPETANFKETVEGVICTHCNTENAAHAKFCINCGERRG
jgi:ribosomal protein L40E